MRIWVSVVAATALAAGVVGACTSEAGGDVGAPCAVDTDCSGDLICDEHQGAGSCQEPHGHGEDTEGDSEGETEHEDTEHDHDSGSETGHHDTDDDHADSSSGGTGGTGAATTTGDPTTGGAVDDECAMYCDCMQTTCSQYDAYPFVDRAGCMDY
nr:hypothetical protein [Deltaproteobacteria bacterium]